VTPGTAERRFGAIGVAVVGLGYWGPNLVRNFFEIPEAELVAVCDLEPERLDRISRRYPDVRRTTSYAELLEDPAIEGIAIATTVSTHFALAQAALEAGKHVLVEKPMATSSKEALELIALAQNRGRVLMPGHTFLYSPPVNTVRDLIQSGELGDIYFISSSRVNLGLHQPDVSVVWDLGPHDFSILRYWLEEKPLSVSATSRGCVMPHRPDVAFVNLCFPSGAIANVHLAWLAPTKLRQTVVVGSRKMVVYDDTSREPVRIHDSGAVLDDPVSFGEYRLTYRTGPIISPPIEATEPLALELRDFCNTIRGKHEPRSSAQIGLDVVEIVEAVELAIAGPGAPVWIDHSNEGSSHWRGSSRIPSVSLDR
jgi:predicted dehydrogenase